MKPFSKEQWSISFFVLSAPMRNVGLDFAQCDWWGLTFGLEGYSGVTCTTCSAHARQVKGTGPGLLHTTVNGKGQLSVPARLKEIIFTDFPSHVTWIKSKWLRRFGIRGGLYLVWRREYTKKKPESYDKDRKRWWLLRFPINIHRSSTNIQHPFIFFDWALQRNPSASIVWGQK